MNQNVRSSIHLYKDFVAEVIKNAAMGNAAVRRLRSRRPRAGVVFTGRSEEIERYAFGGLRLLQEFGVDINERSICEIGPGDYLTSGLSLLAAGASHYAVIDRFPGDYSGELAKRWYRGIYDGWSKAFPRSDWPDWLNVAGFPENLTDRVEIIRKPIEAIETENRFDIVCSFQVGEHVSDIDAFAAANVKLLKKPGGLALHRVDFGPHGPWGTYADPMTFLRFSDRTWTLTGSNRGVPNRRRHHEFLDAFHGAGLEVETVLFEKFDANRVDLSKLHSRFRSMPRESLMTQTAIYRLELKS